jgi:DNA-binding winged helix-turn-helix (wHTH) protein
MSRILYQADAEVPYIHFDNEHIFDDSSRNSTIINNILTDYTFNSGKYLISSTDVNIDLQPMESMLLEILCKNAGNYVLKNEILGTLWPGLEKENAAHNLDVQMGKIKELFSKEKGIQFITKKGVGIMLMI